LVMERALITKGQSRFWRRSSRSQDGNCLVANCERSTGVTQSRWIASPPPVMSGKIGSRTLQLSAKLETLQFSAELSKSRAIQKKAPAGEEQRALLTGGGRKSGQSPPVQPCFGPIPC